MAHDKGPVIGVDAMGGDLAPRVVIQGALEALREILERLKVLTEPAASCTLAAAKRLRRNFGPDSHVALVLCGGNAALGDLWR